MTNLIERLREPVTPRIYSLDVASMRLAAAYIEELQGELEKQCRLLGMGSEREARLMARVEELERAARMALEALSGQHPLSVGKDVAITALRTALGETK